MVVEDLETWRARRRNELAAPDSWLGLVGLYWLQRGANTVGTAETAAVVLPEGAETLGWLIWEEAGAEDAGGGSVRWQPVCGEARVLATDRDRAPDVVDVGSLSFYVVDREGQLAARVRDRRWADSRPFAGLDDYPFDPDWVVTASWETLEPPVDMEVPNASGELKRVRVAHRAVFETGGEAAALLPMSVTENEVFFVFRDRTSGRETYGAGRFLRAQPAADGRIVLDFNRAFNPPCAFTPFATCPLPPPENWLSFAIPAGEKKYAGKS